MNKINDARLRQVLKGMELGGTSWLTKWTAQTRRSSTTSPERYASAAQRGL